MKLTQVLALASLCAPAITMKSLRGGAETFKSNYVDMMVEETPPSIQQATHRFLKVAEEYNSVKDSPFKEEDVTHRIAAQPWMGANNEDSDDSEDSAESVDMKLKAKNEDSLKDSPFKEEDVTHRVTAQPWMGANNEDSDDSEDSAESVDMKLMAKNEDGMKDSPFKEERYRIVHLPPRSVILEKKGN